MDLHKLLRGPNSHARNPTAIWICSLTQVEREPYPEYRDVLDCPDANSPHKYICSVSELMDIQEPHLDL